MSNVLEILVKVLDQATGPLKGIKGALGDLDGSKVGNKFQKIGKQMMGTGAVMTAAVTAPVMAMGTGMIRTAAQFESSMNKVAALTGATGQSFTDLRNLAKKLGSTTEFSASQAGDAMAFFGASGYATENIMGAMAPTLSLASATGTDLAATADMISNSFQAAGVPIEQFAAKSEAIGALFSKSNLGTDLMPLGTQLSRVAGAAKGAGLDINETVAAIGVLGGAGQMNSAGTNLGNIFKAFADSKKSAMLEQVGVAVSENGKFRKFGDILTDLSAATQEMSQTKQAEFLTKAFGVEGARGMQALLDNVENGTNGYKDLVKAANAAEMGGGLKEMQATMQSGLSGQLTQLGSAWEGLAIAVGDTGLLSAVTGIVQGITGLVQAAANAPPIFLQIGVAIAAIAAAVGPALVAIGAVVGAIGTIVTAFSAGGALAGVGTAIGAAFAGLGGIVMAAIAPVGGVLLSLFAALLPAIAIAGIAMAGLGAAFLLAGGQMSDIGPALSIAKQHLVQFPQNLAQIPSAIGAVFGMIGSYFTLFAANVRLTFAQIGMAISQIGMQLMTAFTGALASITGAFAGIGAAISGTIASISGAIASMVATISSGFAQIPGLIQGAMSQAVGIVQGAVGMFQSAGAALMQALASGIQSAVGAAVSAVSGAVSQIRGMLPFSPAKYGPLSDLDKTGPALLNTMAAGINANPVLGAMQSALTPLAGMMTSPAMMPAPAFAHAVVTPDVSPVQSGQSSGGDTINLNITINGGDNSNPRSLAEQIYEEILRIKEQRDRLKY